MIVLLDSILARLTKTRILLVFMLLVLPIVFAPYHADDFFHLLILQHDPLLQRGGDGSLLGLFSFVDENPDHRQQLLRYGVLPWWTSETYHFRFWRPLGELTHWLDFALFGKNPLLAHIHSILWFLLASAVFFLVAKKTIPDSKPLLLLCLAIFMWDGQHIGTISWIANRSALMGLVFGLLALYCHICWRENRRWHWSILAHLLLILSFGTGEIALAILGYLFAYAYFIESGEIKTRMLSVAGYLLLALFYVALHRHLDFGASTSDSYINIFTAPLEFMAASVERFFVYVNSVFLPVPAGSSRIGGDKYWYLSLILFFSGLFLLPALLFFFRQLLANNRQMAFWFYGAMISAFPITAAPAQDRLTLFMTVGIDIFIANIIYFALLARNGEKKEIFNGKNMARVAKVFVVFHLILSPLHLLGGTTIMHVDTRSLLESALALDDDVPVAGKKLLVLEMPLGISISMMGMRKAMGEQLPESAFFIGNEEGDTRYEILSDREIKVSRDIGFSIGYETVFRSVRKEPFTTGEIIRMHNLDIEIMEVNGIGRPMSVKLRLDEDINSGIWLFYHFGKGWIGPGDLEKL